MVCFSGYCLKDRTIRAEIGHVKATASRCRTQIPVSEDKNEHAT